MAAINSNGLAQSSIYSDLNSLDSIRRQGKVDEVGAVKEAAKEFEAFFMNMMLKSMREAGEVLAEDNPFTSQQEKMFTAMMDEQMSVDLSRQSHFGIADLMTQQFTSAKPAKAQPGLNELIKIRKGYEYPDPISPKLDTVQPTVQSASNEKFDLVEMAQKIQFKKLFQQVESKSEAVTATNNVNPVQASQPVEAVTKPEKRSLFAQATDFIQSLLPLAEKAVTKLASGSGVSLDPKLLVAQAALETGWGKYVMHDEQGKPGFNLFGIKAGESWQGESIQIDTLEVEEQEFKKVNATFRKYTSFEESFEDYVKFVAENPRYQTAVDVIDDAQQYIQELQNSGYATDPQYAEKILNIYNDKKLQNFDTSSSADVTDEQSLNIALPHTIAPE